MRNAVISIVLVAFIIIIFSTYFLILNLLVENSITDKFTLIENYTRDEDWNNLIKTTKDLKNDWNNKKPFIMLNFGEAEIKVFENHLNYIIGATATKELDSIKSNILAAKNLWNDMKRIVPEP